MEDNTTEIQQIISAEFLEHRTFSNIDLSQIDLSEKEFAYIIFEHCTFSQTNMTRSQFENITFQDCSISNCKTENTQFTDISFKQCKITGFDTCRFDQSVFDFSFTACKLLICNFSDAHMKGVKFLDCDIEESYFQHTYLINANFTGSRFINTLFDQCDMRKSNFERATGYAIDPRINIIEKSVFSLPDALSLLDPFKITIH